LGEDEACLESGAHVAKAPSKKARSGPVRRRLAHSPSCRQAASPRLQPDSNPMPFDGKRLIYGGFEVLVDI
jgi:uncharacterized protein YbaA (DUF1428 family)